MFFIYHTINHIPIEGSGLSYLVLKKTIVLARELHTYLFRGYGQSLNPSKFFLLQLPDNK